MLQEEFATMCLAYTNEVFEPSEMQGEVARHDSAATASSSASITQSNEIPGDPEWDMHQTHNNGLFLPDDLAAAWEQPSAAGLGSREIVSEAEPTQAATSTGTIDTEIVPYQDRLRHHVVANDIAEADPMSAAHPMGVSSQTSGSDTSAQLSTQTKHVKQAVSVRKSVHRIMREFTLSHDPEDFTNSLKVHILLQLLFLIDVVSCTVICVSLYISTRYIKL